MGPPDKDDDSSSYGGGASLGPDGKLESPTPLSERVRRIEQTRPARPPSPEAVELADRPARPPSDYVAAPAPPPVRVPGRGPGMLLVLLVVGVLGAGGWYLVRTRFSKAAPTPVVLITSDPPGASVRIDGKVVGTTPWAADNAWGTGPVKVEVTRPGYRTWTGTFGGGGPARLDVQLQKR